MQNRAKIGTRLPEIVAREVAKFAKPTANLWQNFVRLQNSLNPLPILANFGILQASENPCQI
jgi:hypothetical protein